MLFRKLTKWDDPAKTPALLFVVQIIEEMLFEFSLDTYKASVMHTGLLCQEARATIADVEAGNIKSPNIAHVAAELAANLEKDPVALSLAPLPASAFMSALKNPKTPTKELETVLELLAVQFSPNRYRQRNEDLLLQAVEAGAPYAHLRRLARTYVTTLTALGFSTRYLQEQTQDFFHYGSGRITGAESLRSYFKLFPSEQTEYIVVFRADRIFDHVVPALSGLKIAVSKDVPKELDLTQLPPSFTPSDDVLFATVQKVSAADPYSARDSAERLLNLTATLLTLFHHRERPDWAHECVVYATKTKVHLAVSEPINSMQKCADLQQSVASKRLQEFASSFSLEADSFSKFLRSAELHALAVRSNADENQILNLWIALESLVPSESKSDDISNIEHIIRCLLPFLNFGYVERLVNNLVKDLLQWNSEFTRSLFKAIPGRKFTDKVVRLVALPDFSAPRRRLEDSFKDFHLLRDRFDYFKQMLSTSSSVAAALDAHSQRLEWQIRRIYRTRNIIVHSGITPRYTKPLIEHTHDYLDTVLSLLVRLASKPKTIDSVGQGFKYVELRYRQYYEKLSEKGVVFDTDNIDTLVFCR
ncbi:MAG: hypothetical protein HGA75_14485 [Thiobacillus sp.]|nr:hypothetical protein [Thiobacillus sp.]